MLSRKDDLERSIRDSYAIIRQYETIVQNSDRPEEKARARRVIQEQWALAEDCLKELDCITQGALPADIAQIAAHFAYRRGKSSSEAAAPPVKGEALAPTKTQETMADGVVVAETPQRPTILGMVLLNLLLWISFALVLWVGNWLKVPCRYSPVVSLSVAMIVLAFGHGVWRLLGSTLDDVEVTIGPIKIKKAVAVLDTLHPRELPDWVFCILLGVLIASGLVAFVWGPIPPEETPVIDGFSAKYVGTNTDAQFVPGDLVEIRSGQQIWVEAITLCEAEPKCTWGRGHGSLSPSSECSIFYTAPFENTYDFLDVRAQSPCKTLETWAGLHIKVIYQVP